MQQWAFKYSHHGLGVNRYFNGSCYKITESYYGGSFSFLLVSQNFIFVGNEHFMPWESYYKNCIRLQFWWPRMQVPLLR